jgi:hypothetical protein
VSSSFTVLYTVSRRRRRAIEQLGARERIAGGGLPGLKPGREPVLALGRRSVREEPWIERFAGSPGLKVIADQGGCLELFLHVADRQLVAAIGRMSPNAGQAVGLQLNPHGQRVLAGGISVIRGRDSRVDPE